jgi:hypothetical protein
MFAQSASKYNISGYIRDTANGESLIAATIAVVELSKGTNTNDYGFFSMDLPPGHHTLKVSYVGYQTQMLPVNLTKDVKINFELHTSSQATKEVVVTAEKKDANVTSTAIGRQELSIAADQRPFLPLWVR